MNLQESIRRLLKEEDFIPLEDLYTVIKDYEDGFDVFIMNKDKKIGEISFAKEDKPNQYTIVDATIDDEYKGNRIYSKTIINLFKERPNIIINSVFRSPEAEKAWKYLLSDLPSNIEHKVKYYEDEETTLYQLKLKNLQESIRRILKEETDSVKNLNESKTSQHLKLMNNLLDPLKEKDCLCDIKISFDVEENYYDIYLVFSQKELHEKFFNLYGIRSYIQKMMNEVKMELESFLPIRNVFIGNYTKPNCEWSPLNESEDDKEKKIQKNLKVINELINMFDYSEVCDMWVEYDPEDSYYAIMSKMSTKNHNTAALEKEFEFLEDSIKSLGLNAYINHPYYVENCEDEFEFLNESEDDKEKKIQKNLKAIRHLLDTIDVDGLCEMWVEYNPEDGDYEIRSKTTIRYYDMEDMLEELGYIEDTIRSWKLKTYVFSPYYVENCEDEIEFLNESEEKKSGLLKAIEEDGLYEVITSTSLHIHEIEQKVGQLSREILERFIIDVVKENHSDIDEDGQTYYIYLEDYPFNEVPVGNNDYVEQLKVTNNELLFVVSHFEEDKYGELEFSSKELIPSNNLEYDNIYEIAGQMGFLLSKGLI